MGMYLNVAVVYGVAWEPIETGEPVWHNTLTWGDFGMTTGSMTDRYLAVCDTGRVRPAANYAMAVPDSTDSDRARWDKLILAYCKSIGLVLDREPGWLAVGSFG